MDNETLRKAQLVQLEIAKEIKRVCEENNIIYFLEAGTLLGAVRHKGFIPWDDDLDLGMIRAEYEKFLRIAPEKLDEKYELVEWASEKEYPHPFCKVMKKGTIYKEAVQQNSSKCGVWVDIFPYDNYPEDKDARQEQKVKLTTYRTLIRAKCQYKTWIAHNKIDVKKWAKNMPFRILALFHKKEDLVKKYECLVKKYNDVDCDCVFSHGCDAYGHGVTPKSCFAEYVQLPFEDDTFSCPSGYELYLESLYGDYMQLPPESERENRHSIVEVDFGENE